MTALRALWRTPRARTITVVVLIVALLAGYLLLRPSSDTPTAETRTAVVTVPGGPGEDGPVDLDTTLYLPEVTPAPAVLMAHGFGGSKNSVAEDAEQLAADGFVVLAYSARGFGQSTGSIHLNSLDHEVADGRALIDHLATLPEVSLDAPGDPTVGVTGGSYGGALSLMVAGTDPRVDAAVPLITWYDLEQALFPNGVVDAEPGPTPAALPTSDDGVFKKAWASTLIASVTAGIGLTGATGTAPIDTGDSGFSRRDAEDGAGEEASAAPTDPSGLPAGLDPATLGCGRLAADVCAAYSQAAQTGRLTPEFSELLANSSPSAVVGDITAPTLVVQGEQDTLFGLDQADANASAIAANGTTVAMTWFNGGHDGGSADTVTREQITEWFRHFLSGEGAAPSTGFTYSLAGPLSETGRARTRTLQAVGYPGIGDDPAVTRRDVPLSGGPQVALHPAGGAPAGISSLPGLSGGLAGTALSLLAGGLPGQSARFTSDPVADLTVVAGAPRVTLEITTVPGAGAAPTDEAVLYVSLSEVSEGGLRTLAGSAVMPVRVTGLTPGTPTEVTVALPAVALQVEAGNRVQVSVATTDQAFAGSTAPAVYRIALAGDPSVSLPIGTGERISAGEIPIGLLIGLIVLLVVGIAALVVVGRLRTRSSKVAGDTSIPLRITGLRKSYPGGVHAVQDVSLTVEPGQVLGLLGPNGAGKTTTLRMVMGLIQPTAGEILVFGRPIRPGAEILSRVGSFVEGSGFLPHLSGEANLDLYWRATGRPMADAHLEEALEIAGLGKAVRRRVKTYSQGMRQRLAIAQAMLGLPDLLILDEPTNGLDPPQIHAMREVLRRYAATGRTVVVSSHLLSEVEQTCSHVVVVHQGRTIAAGTVADMVATSGDMQFTLTGPDSAERAAQVLAGLDGIGEVTVYEQLPHLGTVHADLGSVVPAAAVAALVEAGLPVASAAPRHRLEDVFLELVGATAPEGGGTR